MLRRVAFVVAVVAALVAVPRVPASAKSFRIAAVQIEATLNPDASMDVVEHLTYDFEGEFHNGSRPIPPGDYDLVDLRVTEGERQLELPSRGAPNDLAWSFDARDERRTFDVRYRVLRAARVGPDVAELHWKFVGADHPGVGEVRVALDVPGDGLDVRAWGHGPLGGGLELQGNRILFRVVDLPPRRFVEGRVAVPSAAFPAIVPSGGPRLPGILAEETRLADEANRQREREEAAERLRGRLREALARWYGVVPVLGWFVFAVLWLRYGREHRPPDDVGDYVREPPDDPPALVPTLFRWGSVDPIVLSATIVDLAQRGYLRIDEVRSDRWILPDKVDWKLTRTSTEEPERPYERAVVARLFAEAGETTQAEFATWCRRHRTSAARWWASVQKRVGREFEDRRYVEGGKGPVYAANIVTGIAVVASGAVTVANQVPVGAVGIVAGALQLVATVSLRRRTPAGVRRLAEWKAFRRYLEDFSRLDEAPVGHLVLWERYLVYAVALGVTAEVARALEARIPAEAASSFAPWFSGHQGPGALHSVGSLSGFAGGFGPSVVAAARPPSSSSSGSGGGGGFSGGGGGGGGGGIGAS